jgi:Leucine-rich repeat (LRR) protein
MVSLEDSERQFRFEAFGQGLAAFASGWESPVFKALSPATPEVDLSNREGLGIVDDASAKNKWEALLPTLKGLRFLWLKTRAGQSLFEAACCVTSLQRLDVEMSSIASLNSLPALSSLTHFAIGSSPRVESIEPIARLLDLRALALRGRFATADLSPVGEVKGLLGLTLGGLNSKKQTYDSLESLKRLRRLRMLSIYSLVLRSGGLAPIAHLKSLEFLFLSFPQLRSWPKSEFQRLNEAFPNLRNNVIRLAATDVHFQQRYGIK